jgi:hypothetical protein
MTKARNSRVLDAAESTNGCALDQLRLSPADLAALSLRGTVRPEIGYRGFVIYKLRFRVDGKQRVKYLGKDPDFAAAVEAELRELQFERNRRRYRRANRSAAIQSLRTFKRLVEPLLAEAGYHFHGYAIRRRKNTGQESTPYH